MTILGMRSDDRSTITYYFNNGDLLYARGGASASSSNPLVCYENFVRANGPAALSSYRAGGNRGYYRPITESFNATGSDRNIQGDIDAGRFVHYSSNVTTTSIISGSQDATIDARAAELEGLQASNPDWSMAWTINHEPNNGGYTATDVSNWWRACERIWTRWTVTPGNVAVWEGTQDGATTSPGLILAGPNMAGAAGITNPAQYDDWYLTPATESWGWANMQMACHDMYQGSASGNGTWRAFEEMAGYLTTSIVPSNQARPGFLSWVAPKVQSQNALGRVLLRSVWEFACDDYNKTWNGSTSNTTTRMFTSNSNYWNTLPYPDTQAGWMQGMLDFLEGNPGGDIPAPDPNLYFSICFWDSCAGSGSGPTFTSAGRGPHMIDMDTEAMDFWMDSVLTSEVFSASAPVTQLNGWGLLS